MDYNLIEAKKALEKAEAKFNGGDVPGAVQMALKAKRLFPNLHGLAAHLEAYRIHSGFDPKSPARTDWYAILNVKRSDDMETVRLRFKSLRALTHLDKNSSSAAEGAFKLVYKAWETICKDLGGCPSNTGGKSTNTGGKSTNTDGKSTNYGGSNGNTEGYNSDVDEEEECGSSSYSSAPETAKCPECSRQCNFIDSRKTVAECKRCKLTAIRRGSGTGFVLVIREGFATIDIKGELNTTINVYGGSTEINGVKGVHIYGGESILLNRCKGVELKGGDSIHISNSGNININGTGNISYG